MITAFEATILGFLSNRRSSRYEMMKVFQTTSYYWSGSPGAVYSAIARLEKGGLLQAVESAETKPYEITNLGRDKLVEFLKDPISANKILIDPVALRIKLMGLKHLKSQERKEFCTKQLHELEIAKSMVSAKQAEYSGLGLSERLAELAIAQIDMEAALLIDVRDGSLQV